jgi:phosphopantothenoylcysteine decarboxylase/phosphopantothenate--cysteine ligase
MWENPVTQDNLRALIARRGVHVVGPGDGFLACRWTGPGRLAEPADIVEAAAHVLTPQDLADRRIVVTAGPTHEAIDPVRFVGNRSSGKMGMAIARAAARRGALVHVVLGPSALAEPPGIAVERVTTAREMDAAVRRAAAGADAVIMAAAVADVRPASAADHKIKKTDPALSALTFERNPDILAALGTARGDSRSPLLVGFAAETGDPVASARTKLAAKRCDLVVANDVSESGSGFEVDTNRVTLVDARGAIALERMTKDEVAHRVLDRVVELLYR